MAKTALFLADGFEEIEALTPVDILRRGGVSVKTVGIGGNTVKGSHNISVLADITENELDFKEIDAVILPGGIPGTVNLGKSEAVISAINFAWQNGKIIGAICAAPSILGDLGILKGKKAICFDGFENHLTGAVIERSPVVSDGNIITACGAGAAHLFGFELLSKIKDKNTADKLRAGMKYI